MDLHVCGSLTTFIFFSILCYSRAQNFGSVFFFDSPKHQFLRTRSPDAAIQIDPMLLSEVGAAVSVLLGFAPSPALSAASSVKLNEVLMPNPFYRPRAVFMLEIRGAEDSQLVFNPENSLFSSALRTSIIPGSSKADIQLPDQEEVSIVSLNDVLHLDSDSNCTDQEISDLALWLGGSYITDPLKPLGGELSIPLANGVTLKLHMSKKADGDFTACLVSLVRSIRKAIQMHEDLSGRGQGPAELITGRFDGIKHYGSEGVGLQGIEIMYAAISKTLDSLQAVYKGELVGVIFYNEKPFPKSEGMLNVIFTSHSTSRCLAETTGPLNSTTIQQVVLVRRTLAWLTGILLLIATFLGIYFLLNMPLTRDSLLYSNVKLD